MVKVYDIKTDEFREATQEDVDRMASVVQAYGRLIECVERLEGAANTAIALAESIATDQGKWRPRRPKPDYH
jgi:hypothetical protein